MSGLTDTANAEISREEIELHVEKVVASRAFANSQRLIRFLRFTVRQVLFGGEVQLKEYVIATEVFDKAEDFDARTNSTVRVEAGRLRLKLKEYYKTEGRFDALRVVYAKGTYLPRFKRQTVAQHASRNPSRRGSTIAVLPLVDLSENRDEAHFCESLTEELIDRLMKSEGVRVVSRTSVAAFKECARDVREIGTQLGANLIVEGSVRKLGDWLRITARLSSATDGCQLWSDTHDVIADGIFAARDQTAGLIIDKLTRFLTPKSRIVTSPHFGDHTAYNLYLKGRYYWNKRTDQALRTSIECFEQAIDKESRFALAYVGLADSYAMLGNRGAAAPSEVFPKAKNAVEKALKLDPSSAEAHTSLAVTKAVYEWDWLGAAQEFKRAMKLNPGYATAPHWYAVNCLAPLGRLEEAIVELRRAEELDPISLVTGAVLGRIFYFHGQYDTAIKQLQKTIEMEPTFYLAYWHLGQAYQQKGMHAVAVEALQRAKSLSASPHVIASLGETFAQCGRRTEARQALEELHEMEEHRYICSTDFARLHLALGQRDQALMRLRRALQERAVGVIHIGVDPAFAALRTDPAFMKIVQTVRNSSGSSVSLQA